MKNKQLTAAIFILLSSISLSSYATSHNAVTKNTVPVQQLGYSVHSVDSGRAALSSVSVTKRKDSYVVTGDVRIKTMQRRILRLPGYITIELKDANGEVLESVKARFSRKFSTSKAARLHGTLKTTPPAGSTVVVTHNN